MEITKESRDHKKKYTMNGEEVNILFSLMQSTIIRIGFLTTRSTTHVHIQLKKQSELQT